MPSCASHRTMSAVTAGLLLALEEMPGAVLNLHEDAGALVQAVVVLWIHVVDAMRADHAFDVLERATQRLAELCRAGLAFLQRRWRGGIEQQVAIVGVAGEGVARARTEGRFIALG